MVCMFKYFVWWLVKNPSKVNLIIFQGGKTGGSPHVGRKFEGPHIGQNHMPTAALLHEAKLGEASLSTPPSLSLFLLTL